MKLYAVRYRLVFVAGILEKLSRYDHGAVIEVWHDSSSLIGAVGVI